jgi:DNA-binding CsgD family transcriptional regulator
MKAEYLKIPVELAQNSFVEGFYKQAGTYLASQFYYSGKARLSDKPAQKIANRIGVSTRSVYRHFNWLLGRNWMGKDNINGWLFFRGLDRIREIEGWKRKRAAVMLPEDLQNFKEFLIGAVLSSIIKTGKGTGTDRKSRRSEQSRFPISLSLIQKVLGVSRKTAFTYRKIAKKKGFINMIPNLRQVTGISSKDIQLLKQNNANRVKVNLFGSSESIQVKPQQLRTDKGYVYAQLANLITANVQLRKR